METLSRVKKYEELRKQIENDTVVVGNVTQEETQGEQHKGNEIDPSIFKKITVTQEEEPYVPERERTIQQAETSEDTKEEFRNEYLDDFINEVREYNIRKGNRECEDTQIDILNQLQAISRPKRSDFIQPIEDRESKPAGNSEIAAQVMNLIKEEEEDPLVEELMRNRFVKESQTEEIQFHEDDLNLHSTLEQKEETVLTPKKETALSQSNKDTQAGDQTLLVDLPGSIRQERSRTVKDNQESNTKIKSMKTDAEEAAREEKLHQKLVEETQQLRVQLNEYEDDLNDLSEGVEKTNKLLNVILGFLILALLVIIGIIVYWIMQAGGMM